MTIGTTVVLSMGMAARLFQNYTQRRVFAERTDRTWQGVLANGGNTIRISKGAAQSVGDYVSDQQINYANADAVHVVDLGAPKQKYWAVKIDDIRALQSSANLLDDAVRASGIDLAETVDADVKAAFDDAAGATPGPAIALNHNDYVGNSMAVAGGANDFQFPLLHRVLDVAKMPAAGRWLMVGAYTAEVMRKYSLLNSVLNAPINAELQNGSIGSCAGFNIYVYDPVYSVFTPGATASDPGEASEPWYFGNDTACAFVDQLDSQEQLRLQDTFADAVRGLYTYGAKVVDRSRLYRSVATIANVPVIA